MANKKFCQRLRNQRYPTFCHIEEMPGPTIPNRARTEKAVAHPQLSRRDENPPLPDAVTLPDRTDPSSTAILDRLAACDNHAQLPRRQFHTFHTPPVPRCEPGSPSISRAQ
ncbi:hypothetical protein RHCRD62_20551 [Rhodococcus sp. RD6.2]|nr:hypothetical protein RHCRD62_20551 [Rhodococcus sp. RD6.2]